MKRLILGCLLWMGVGLGQVGLAEELVFALIPHSTSDENFLAAYEGMKVEAEKNGDKILFLGKDGAGHTRNQINALQKAFKEEVDGIALAPMKVDKIAAHPIYKQIREANIPVMLFESDFLEADRSLRDGYVGTNGVDMGRALGRLVQTFKPDGGKIALMANTPGHKSIEDRMRGFREVLSENESYDAGKLTKGGENKGNWIEQDRTPWYCEDKYDRALSQLVLSLKNESTDVFVSLGWWPQMAEKYRETITPFKGQLESQDKLIISGDASSYQLGHLKQGLAHGNVSQDFEGMGIYMYDALRKLNQGEEVKDVHFTPVNTITRDNVDQFLSN